jgi:acyl-CoA synthetase (AMP-forming)/AMP-acid ligase II
LARGFHGFRVVPGDRVAIHLDPANALRWVVTYAAIHRAGAVAVPFNPQLTRPEVARMIDHSGAAATVTEASLVNRYQNGAPGLVISVPSATGTLGEAGSGTRCRGDDPPDVLPWSEALDSDASYLQVPRQPEDLADILYTSGTTGHPKGVAVRHDNSSMVPFAKPTWSGQGWMHASPPYTFAGISFVYTPMKLGMRVIFQPRFAADQWFDTVESERPVSRFPGSGHGHPAAREPPLRRGRPELGDPLLRR